MLQALMTMAMEKSRMIAATYEDAILEADRAVRRGLLQRKMT